MPVLSRLAPENRRFVVGFISGIIAGICAEILYHHPSRTTDFAAALFLALSLFVVRRELKGVYGVVEILFSLYVLWDAAGKSIGDIDKDFSPDFKSFALSVLVVQMLGAIYILIRGLDNFLQGFPKVKAWWEELY